MRSLLLVFMSVFIAELGDKTQLATLLYATDKSIRPLYVFAAASSALIVSTLLAVLAGSTVTRLIDPSTLQLIAGVAFIAVGIWTIAVR